MLAQLKSRDDIKEKSWLFYADAVWESANPEIHEKPLRLRLLNHLGQKLTVLLRGRNRRNYHRGRWSPAIKKNRYLDSLLSSLPGRPCCPEGIRSHKIAGIGAGFYPGVLNARIYDEVIPVTDNDAVSMVRQLSEEKGYSQAFLQAQQRGQRWKLQGSWEKGKK